MFPNLRGYAAPHNSVNFGCCIYTKAGRYYMDKVIRASFDRIEGDFAVVYSDRDDDHRYKKFDVPLELVKDAKPGMRLQLHIENNEIKHIEIDNEASEGARDTINKKYERLRQGRHFRQQ